MIYHDLSCMLILADQHDDHDRAIFWIIFVIYVVTIGRLWRSTEDPHGSDIHPMVPKRFSVGTFFFEGRKELRVDDHIIDKPFK